MAGKRKIAVVTGSRAEYGIISPVMRKIKQSETLNLQVIVTGMHLLPEFGSTINHIKEDGFTPVAEVEMLLGGDKKSSMAKAVGIGVIGLTQAFEDIKSDLVLVTGDRIEAFAATVSAGFLSIPIAHLFGGDTAAGSNIDDSLRFSITKFAHIHFAATENHAARILKMGEEEWRIHVTGSPAIDSILKMRFPPRSEVSKLFSLDPDKPIALLAQHPTTIEAENAASQIRETLKALTELELQTVVIYPNSDTGGRAMIQVINEYADAYSFIKPIKSLPEEKYFSLMKQADVMVGNSSSGIIEAPSFHLPFVNIGIRQQNRQSAGNTIDTEHDKEDIKKAINKALNDKKFRKKLQEVRNPYGDGKASDRIVNVLSSLKLDKKLLRKKITY